MGHTPNSYTLKNAYAGRFEDLNMTRLIHTSRTETTDTANSIITPSTFRIKDIRQYALTDEELETGIEIHEDVFYLKDKIKTYIDDKNKNYGTTKRAKWLQKEKEELEGFQTRLKRRKRLLKNKKKVNNLFFLYVYIKLKRMQLRTSGLETFKP